MMTGNETTRRRHVQGRSSGTFETTSRTGRPNTVSALHQQQHLHHHHHDHHHYHHHHYHHFPTQLNGDQDQDWLLSSGGNTAPAESLSQSGPRNTDQQRPSVNSRLALMSNFHGVSNPREAAMEARDRLDERLRAAGLLSHRHSNTGLTGNFLEEFSLLFEDDEDTWSDDELWELGIQEWLAALGFGEGWHSDVLSSSELGSLPPGLSKAVIRRLHKEVFVPKGPRRDMEIGNAGIGSSEQDDCSVCLEHFLSGQQLICLPCKHRFHPDCLTPWLESHAQCPYCRGKVTFEGTGEASSSQSGNGSAVSMIEDDLIAWMEAVDSRLSRLNMG